MSKNNYIKKQKKYNLIKYILLSILIILLILNNYILISIAVVIIYYLYYLIFNSDQIFYNIKQNQHFPLAPDCEYIVKLNNYKDYYKLEYINTKNTIDSINIINNKYDTWILKSNITTNLLGHFFDPYLIIKTPNDTIPVYFERGAKGNRYIVLPNFNNFTNKISDLSIKFKYCKFANNNLKLYGFKNNIDTSNNILILAPHADDAEIAAFGLYSQNKKNSYIATITAGETEIKDYHNLTNNIKTATLLKGKLRSLDSFTAGKLAGLEQNNIINLGYFCRQLTKMSAEPSKIFNSYNNFIDSLEYSLEYSPAYYRIFNTIDLPTDLNPKSNWESLLTDLNFLINKIKPSTIITPNPELDSHEDHIATTKALHEVLKKSEHQPNNILLYANHYYNTQHYPAGNTFSGITLPPVFYNNKNNNINKKINMVELSNSTQINKYCALALMHDLRRKQSLKKILRQWLQSKILNRGNFALGNDQYLRKAVRYQELFININPKELSGLFDEDKK